jgi:hypothetical protein
MKTCKSPRKGLVAACELASTGLSAWALRVGAFGEVERGVGAVEAAGRREAYAEAAQVSGIPYIMDAYKEEAYGIINS